MVGVDVVAGWLMAQMPHYSEIRECRMLGGGVLEQPTDNASSHKKGGAKGGAARRFPPGRENLRNTSGFQEHKGSVDRELQETRCNRFQALLISNKPSLAGTTEFDYVVFGMRFEDL